MPKPSVHDPFAALRFRDYRLYTLALLLATMGYQMQSVAIGWELYERTNSAFALGLVGLVQVIPILLLSLPAGQLADRFERKHTVMWTLVMLAICSVGLAALSYKQGSIELIYACLGLGGVARAFNQPASEALLPQLVPLSVFSNAATWHSSSFQLATVVGPALGGLIIALQNSATEVYGLDAALSLTSLGLIVPIVRQRSTPLTEPVSLKTLAGGIQFVWQHQVILAAIALDLFAVLLGGAVTLLPIFARDILHVGASGLGWLRAAPSIGAVLMAVTLAYLPPLKQAGKTLLWAVAGFGVVTIIFGLSHWFWLSLLMLALSGAFDNVSVVVRRTLVQVGTPDSLRGRVSAVSAVFIGASNELGGFESGLAAALLSPVGAVVMGGMGTIVVVLTVALLSPKIRQLSSLQPTLDH
ncbi:MAG: MFS transporter [Stenomitos rutilans HA7619-LM2]|jgi:MFS family permease|nr:MFS transporter [Stenomitos rutilans HA7619-LM2]